MQRNIKETNNQWDIKCKIKHGLKGVCKSTGLKSQEGGVCKIMYVFDESIFAVRIFFLVHLQNKQGYSYQP